MKILAHDDKNEIVLVAFTGAVIKILYFRKSLPLLLQSVQIWKQFFDMNRDNEQLFTSNLFAEYVWDTTLLIVSSAIRLNYLYHQFYCSNTNDISRKYSIVYEMFLWFVSIMTMMTNRLYQLVHFWSPKWTKTSFSFKNGSSTKSVTITTWMEGLMHFYFCHDLNLNIFTWL